MLFTSPEFIFLFLPIAVALHFAIARVSTAAAAITTTLSSLFFYAWWNPPFILLPVASVLFNLWIANQIAAPDRQRAKRMLIAGIAANLLVLGYFKYSEFIVSIVEARKALPPNVPLALSFTTFVQIAFLVDVYQRPRPIGRDAYALFVVFFPHLIAGPIVRWRDLGPQIADPSRYRIDWNNVSLGLTIFVFGLAKKILIADQLGLFVAPVFDAAARGDAVTGAAAWGGAFAYTAQLYFDFSGYSDMAIGLGLLFNLRLPVNFATPFRATSVIELWRRWHISLSRFLRDFVYVPLGGSRQGRVRTARNLFVTMTLGGLWHGAGWTFIVWGAFHGVLLAINHAWRTLRGAPDHGMAGRLVGWMATLTAFAIGMVLFRAADIDAAGRLLAAMSGLAATPTPPMAITLEWDQWAIGKGYVSGDFVRVWFGSTWTIVGTLWTVIALAIAVVAPDTMEIVGYSEGVTDLARMKLARPFAWRPSLTWVGVIAVLFVTTFLNIGRVQEFLYYQF